MAHARRIYNLVGEKNMSEPWLLSDRGRIPREDTMRGREAHFPVATAQEMPKGGWAGAGLMRGWEGMEERAGPRD